MKTSVVMATYNGEKFLNKQLDSIASQSVLPDELVIVDDGSKDSTRQLLSDFAEKFGHDISIILVFREKNLGYINNFIDGIARTKNELIFLCDQDDLWHEDKIKETKLFFDSNPDMVALHSNTNIIDQDSNVIKWGAQEYKKVLEKRTVKQFIKKVNYPGMALAFRKGVILPKLLELDKQFNLPTHDWVIGFLGAINEGFYVTCKVFTFRRYTGENVALQLDSNSKNFLIDERIQGIDLYKEYYELVSKYQILFGEEIIDINQYLSNAEIRVKYLRSKNLLDCIRNLRNINYYPSYSSFLKDIIMTARGNGG